MELSRATSGVSGSEMCSRRASRSLVSPSPVAAALNDNLLSNSLFVTSDKPYEHIYFFDLASSHLYEAAETMRQARREWQEVQEFVEALDDDRKAEFEKITALADPAPPWPGARLKEIRNSFFHYLRLDRAMVDVGRLPLANGLEAAADEEGLLVIEPGRPLSGIRALFADEVAIKSLTGDYEDGEMERLVRALADYQGDLNRFAQGAIGRYLRELPEGVVAYEEEVASESGQEDS